MGSIPDYFVCVKVLVLVLMTSSVLLMPAYITPEEYAMLEALRDNEMKTAPEQQTNLISDDSNVANTRFNSIDDQLTDADKGEDDEEPDDEIEIHNGKLTLDVDWPTDLSIGQVGGLAFESDGNLTIFHRGTRRWTEKSFDSQFKFREQNSPIKENALLTVDPKSGKVVYQNGKNMFYMPHGLTVDVEGNRWVTDVATHQVLKLSPGSDKPSVVIGRKFEPATSLTDKKRLCQPTDVAVTKNGIVFVADGYCNSRIAVYDSKGNYLTQFGNGDFIIPHSLALAEDLDLLCVADREKQRIMCYSLGYDDRRDFGRLMREYNEFDIGRVFAIEYSPRDGFLYGVNGTLSDIAPTGFTIDLRESDNYKMDIINTWSPDQQLGFDNPHELAVSPTGDSVFVGETGPNSVYKFDR